MKVRFTRYEVYFQNTGLSLKKLDEADPGFFIGDFANSFGYNCQFETNGRTAQIKKDELVRLVAIIYGLKPFKKLVFHDRYSEASAELIYGLAIKKHFEELL